MKFIVHIFFIECTDKGDLACKLQPVFFGDLQAVQSFDIGGKRQMIHMIDSDLYESVGKTFVKNKYSVAAIIDGAVKYR